MSIGMPSVKVSFSRAGSDCTPEPNSARRPNMLGSALLLVSLFLGGCAGPGQTPEQRQEAAKALFESTTKTFHIPSVQAMGREQTRLQDLAAAGYRELLKKYPDQQIWAAQALRSLGNIYAARTNLNAATRYYMAVAKKYPDQEWEILMAWKSAADLLWEHGRQTEARQFYGKIVDRFDQPGQPQIVQTVVRGSKTRSALPPLPHSP
jgi:tetratricopeptide (TPR) repeat protein